MRSAHSTAPLVRPDAVALPGPVESGLNATVAAVSATQAISTLRIQRDRTFAPILVGSALVHMAVGLFLIQHDDTIAEEPAFGAIPVELVTLPADDAPPQTEQIAADAPSPPEPEIPTPPSEPIVAETTVSSPLPLPAPVEPPPPEPPAQQTANVSPPPPDLALAVPEPTSIAPEPPPPAPVPETRPVAEPARVVPVQPPQRAERAPVKPTLPQPRRQAEKPPVRQAAVRATHSEAATIPEARRPMPAGASTADIAAYRSSILGSIAANKRYPESARARGASGQPVVAFRVDGAGRVGGVALTRSSGEADLDAESLAMVRRSGPFPPPPGGTVQSFNAVINYRLY